MTQTDSLPVRGDVSDPVPELKRQVEQAAALLPSQGPITAFVFLNTLQAMETLPFDEAVQQGAALFGCEPYLTEETYRQKLSRDRIDPDDLLLALERDLKGQKDAVVGSLTTRVQLRLAMLKYPLRSGTTEELNWFVAETDALTRMRPDVPVALRERFLRETKHWVMRDLRLNQRGKSKVPAPPSDYPLPMGELIGRFGRASIERWTPETWEEFSLQALWRTCRNAMFGIFPAVIEQPPAVRPRDALQYATGFDTDQLVHPVLIRFCAAFTDQGFANWSLPHRDEGFFRCFLSVYRQSKGPPDQWMRGLAEELTRIHDQQLTPAESVMESLNLLGIGSGEQSKFIAATLLALRGWAGMIWQLEVRPDRQGLCMAPGSLLEYLAVRLILERLALGYGARQALNFDGPLRELRRKARSKVSTVTHSSVEQRAFQIFQLAQVLGWSPSRLRQLTSSDWTELILEIESFSSMERRRMFHQAFERQFRARALDAFSVQTARPAVSIESPRFQSVFCLDTREESFRRHLEELVPDCETFGAAGFFSIPMYYKGVADANYSALCPIAIVPNHWIREEVDPALVAEHQRRAKTRRVLGTASHNVHVRSRSITGGALLTASFGVFASIPLVARVLFPRLTSRIRRRATQFVEPPPVTRLRLERRADAASPEDDGIGFSLEEMARMGERLLRDIGLTEKFSRLVMFLGHGSYCLNNPHKSCYDCGACSGSSGAPNARALAAILNDPRVRSRLAANGLLIPAETHFLGGLHNTCDDSIRFYDLDRLPESHRTEFEFARTKLEETCERNAHERCRRFQSAPLDLSFAAARRHVEGRSEDLAQTRPEFGNASNALCFVGRRERIRGLYLDRRAFQHSYDPNSDDGQWSLLERILQAVVPVCAGINLQYFFSYIDSPGWGCGTKLPHNITSLLGVMDGAASDLRPGLPWQGVEIHEPLRLLFVIETTPDGIRQIMSRCEVVRNLIENGWVQLALLDPDSNQILVLREHEFHRFQPRITELPKAASSADWYRGWREHLEFAQIEP